MRRLAVLSALLAFIACSKRKEPPATIEAPAPPASVINAADPKAAPQFVRGFYEPEQNAWRWTQRNFAVNLRPPFASLQKGGMLRLQFALPDAVVNKLGAVTLDATVGAVALGPQTFSRAGPQAYVREVPASALSGDVVQIEFSADKALPPGDGDKRELAVVVSSVSLEANK